MPRDFARDFRFHVYHELTRNIYSAYHNIEI